MAHFPSLARQFSQEHVDTDGKIRRDLPGSGPICGVEGPLSIVPFSATFGHMQIIAEPLTAAAFAPFGDVLDATGDFRLINAGLCRRHHDRALIDVGDGKTGISIFKAQARTLPYRFDLIERHPEGSQAFLPMAEHPFLVIVSAGPQARPRAFLTDGAQGINLHRGTWHGVLTPLHEPGLFAVVDRIGNTSNLEEFRYATPFLVSA